MLSNQSEQNKEPQFAKGRYENDMKVRLLDKLTAGVLGEGEADINLRKKVFGKVSKIVRTNQSEPLLSTELDGYIEKVSRNAYKIMDIDIAALRASGFAEEEIFELTTVAAVSAGEARVKLALELLGQCD